MKDELRQLVATWRRHEDADSYDSPAYGNCADELESILDKLERPATAPKGTYMRKVPMVLPATTGVLERKDELESEFLESI